MTNYQKSIRIFLNSNISSNISSVLSYQYNAASGSADGSAVYYAVHKALANLKNSENRFPVPDSVYVITFTDGKDNGSSGLSQISPIENQTFTTTASYITYVQNQITNRKIQNKNITAYSIGVKGSDIVTTTDQTDFTTLLQNIAGSGNNRELDNYDEVQATFDEIADGLIQGSNFTLSTTLLESGTRVRMTFDIASTSATQEQITGSSKYIEGTVNITGSGASLTYTFTNITYGGITSDAGTGPITGVRNGTQVNYLFRNITGYSYATDRWIAKQWLKAPGASEWTINSEYTLQNAVFGTAVIYLVLDCSSSISSNIYSIRDAVNSFITRIYNARYNN